MPYRIIAKAQNFIGYIAGVVGSFIPVSFFPKLYELSWQIVSTIICALVGHYFIKWVKKQENTKTNKE